MTRFDATGRRALWTSGQLGTADLTTSPQAQQQQQKRSIHMVHKPVNSVCYRQVWRQFLGIAMPMKPTTRPDKHHQADVAQDNRMSPRAAIVLWLMLSMFLWALLAAGLYVLL